MKLNLTSFFAAVLLSGVMLPGRASITLSFSTTAPTVGTYDIYKIAGDRQNYGKVYIGTTGRGVFKGQ